MSRFAEFLQDVAINPDARAKYRGRAGEHQQAFLDLMRAYELTEEERRAILEADNRYVSERLGHDYDVHLNGQIKCYQKLPKSA